MPDRIIAATAVSLGVPLITRDHSVSMMSSIHSWSAEQANLPPVWRVADVGCSANRKRPLAEA